MSPAFMPWWTGVPSGRMPRRTPSNVQVMGTPPTVAATSPIFTWAPMSRSWWNVPSAGARSTRSPAKPPMRPGMPVLGRALPW